MTLARLIRAPDPRLRASASPIDAHDDPAVVRDAAALGAALTEFRRLHGFGRAIAAPQLGIDRRLIMLDLGAGSVEIRNPEITWRSDDYQELWDDCLSIPEVIVRVRRHLSISLDYHDAEGRRRTWCRLPPDLAELMQHEIDHLDGVLMTDRAIDDDAIRPASERARLLDAVRPRHRLSLDNIREACRVIAPEFLCSPQFISETLSAELGCRLTLKLDYLNPIRSFKGRGAGYLMHRIARECPDRPLVCATAGNWGQALAYACRSAQRPLRVYTAENANPLKVAAMRRMGALVIQQGRDFDAAKDAARAYADSEHAMLLEDGREAAVSEGHGTIGIELLARGDAFDAVVVPLGNGALLTGIGRWIKAASPATAIIGVVASGAPSMRQSWLQGRIVATETATTIADGIAVRQPVPEAVGDLPGTVDDVIEVDDKHILASMRALARHTGELIEPAGAAALAGVLAHRQQFADQSVACIVCGSNLTAEQIRQFGLHEVGMP